jgi:hypothetical protein
MIRFGLSQVRDQLGCGPRPRVRELTHGSIMAMIDEDLDRLRRRDIPYDPRAGPPFLGQVVQGDPHAGYCLLGPYGMGHDPARCRVMS